MKFFTSGSKLVLIGGIIFATALGIYMEPSLEFGAQSLLSWMMMASFIVWLIGALYVGVDGDQWLKKLGNVD
jgi:hypothetical protein